VTEGRPPADKVKEIVVDRAGKLTPRTAAKVGVAEWRCPRQHLLAAVVPSPYGMWLYWRDNAGHGDGWQCAWQADLDSARVRTWCNCRDVWDIDTASPGTPPERAIG
jgi:hypothetical protein